MRLSLFPRLLTACFLLAAATPLLGQSSLPVLASYAMEPDAADAHRLTDSGPLGNHAVLAPGVSLVPGGRRGYAIRFTGEGDNIAKVNDRKLLDRIGAPLTIALWLKADAPAADGTIATILTKREGWWAPTPFSLNLGGKDGALILDTYNGKDGSSGGRALGAYKVGEWVHVAITFQADGERVWYLNGAPISKARLEGTLASNDQPLIFGYEKGGDFPGGGRSKFKGLLDDVHLYAAALTPEQVKADMNGTALPTRAAVATDFARPTHYVHLALTRWDMPLGFSGRISRTRQTAVRVAGPDAVEWPALTLNGQKLFEKSADEAAFYPLRQDPERRPLFHQPFDDVCTVQPGNHWFRAVEWLWGRRYIYTTDRASRGAERDYEIWAFPIKIEGNGPTDVRDVTLRCNGETIYENAGPWHSLTLLLPQNTPGQPYELSVAGRSPVTFDAGLQPVKLGDPIEQAVTVHADLPGPPVITVRNLDRPAQFPNQNAWDDDLKLVAAERAGLDARAQADPNAAPLVAWYPMEPDAGHPDQITDAGPFQYHGRLIDGARLIDGGKRGHALQLDGVKARGLIEKAVNIDRLSKEFTLSLWMKPDGNPPEGKAAFVLTKRAGWWTGKPFSIGFGADRHVGFEGDDGQNWSANQWAGAALPDDGWQHVAVTFKAGGEEVVYLNGKPVAHKAVSAALKPNTEPLVFGYEEGGEFPGGGRSHYRGLVDEVRIYAAALTPAQVAADMDGSIKTRPAGMFESALPAPFEFVRKVRSFPDYVGVEVPRSPLAIHTVNMTHGMSGGHFYGSEHGPGAFNGGGAFPGSVEDYARYLAEIGYDRAFERVNDGIPAPQDARSYERWLAALAAHGVQGGLNIVALNDANLAFYSYTLPDFNRPRERDAQLIVQRFSRFPNLAGVSIGADNAGYAPYWDWAPATPERPWGEAFVQFQQGRPPKAPVPPGMTADKDYEYPTPSMRHFADYIARYDESFRRYGDFARAVREVNPALAFTTQSFGSSPGVGAHGGYRWASIPGLPMHDGVPVLQSYDWDETTAAKPMHNVALIDRLRSYYPEKPAWALLDDFMLKYGREPRQRAFALALTRGLQSIGPNWLAHTTGQFARPQIATQEKELYAWCHKYGGVYAMTEPLASIGVLYVQTQAVARRSDAKEPLSPHEGKTTEALFMAHTAGWPARIVTPEELKRGLPAGMKAVLLVGLNQIDDSWHWYDGLEKELASFVKAGGRLLLDDESAGPRGVPTVKTDIAMRAFVAQGDGTTNIAATMDKTPVLIERNRDNAARLRNAMKGVAAPFAVSDDPTIWALPTVAGDVQYLTVVNQGSEPDRNATEYMKPQTGQLAWTTDRPIYDVRLGRKITAAEAASVDLTKEGFQWYALPPAEIAAPRVAVERGADGFYSAKVEVGEQPVRGVPVQLTVSRGPEQATVYGATGRAVKLPLNESDAGEYIVTATELLGNTSATVKVSTKGAAPAVALPEVDDVKRFAARREVPLTVALTPLQLADAKTRTLADQLVALFAAAGREADVRRIAPDDVVLGLQPTAAAQPFPRWHTIAHDLVLLGAPADNVLLFDEARGQLLPPGTTGVTYSPFTGGFQVLNVYGENPARLTAEVQRLRGLLTPGPGPNNAHP